MIAEKPETRGHQGTRSPATATLSPPPAKEAPRSNSVGAVADIRTQAGTTARPKNRTRRSAAFGVREMATVVIASFLVTLLCLYVSAYARVTAEGYEASRLEKQLKSAAAEEEALRAKIAHLRLPETVRQRAEGMGLVASPPGTVNFLTEGKPSAPPPEATAKAIPDGNGVSTGTGQVQPPQTTIAQKP